MLVHFASKQVAIIFLKKVPNGTIIAKISTILDFLFFDIFFTVRSIMHALDTIAESMMKFLNLYEQWAKQQGYLNNEFFVLYSIGRHGQCTPKQIAQDWCLPKQTVSHVCKQLITKGLVVYQIDSTDKRAKLLRLTTNGQEVVMPMLAHLEQIEYASMREFGEQALVEFETDILKLTQILRQNLGLMGINHDNE